MDTLQHHHKTEKKLAWVYLLNLTFYFIPLIIIDDYPIWKIIASLAVIPPFLYCYFWAFRANKQNIKYPLSLLTLLAVIATPFNFGSIALFSYCGFYSGFYYSGKRLITIWAGLISILWLLHFSLAMPNYYFVLYGSTLIIGIGIIGFASQKREQQLKKDQQSEAEIKQLATMVERERIARDMHDILGHSLSSITLKAELTQKLIEKQQLDEASEHLTELMALSRSSLTQIRQTVSNYKHKGLLGSVTDLSKQLREKSILVDLQSEVPKALPSVIESQVSLILTELCHNILKHSNATQCQIRFIEHSQQLTLKISDNGQLDQITEGNGIKGIRERVDALNGQVDYQVNSQTGFQTQAGCHVTINIPMNKEHS